MFYNIGPRACAIKLVTIRMEVTDSDRDINLQGCSTDYWRKKFYGTDYKCLLKTIFYTIAL